MANLVGPEGILLSASLFALRLSKKPKPEEKPKAYARVGYVQQSVESAPFKAMQSAVVAAAREAWGQSKADAMLKEKSIKLPFRTDIAAKGYPEIVKVYIGGSTLELPQVVSRYKGKDGKPALITNKAEIYPGCIVRVSYSVRAYGGPGTEYSPGIALDLRNVQKLGDGERLARSGDASDDFSAEDEPTGADDAADLASLTA
jgi:hypothetical protein